MNQHARSIYGFMLLGIWAVLIGLIALGKVEEKTSYGLLPCITALAGVSGAWAQSTFSSPPPDVPKKENESLQTKG